MQSARPTPAEAAFYIAQSAFTDPGPLVHRYAGLPAAPRRLADVARGVMIHREEGGLFGHALARDRLHHDAETRYLDEILRRVVERDDAPLTRRRGAGERFVGVCRDFALLHCSLLRHAGVPARLRCGFADYCGPEGMYGDHVVTEYWDETRGWLLADAQLADPVVRDAFAVDFDPMDVPRDRFLVAGSAWRAVRTGEADPMTFGHWRPERPLLGEWFVAGAVRLDLAALNRVETLLWDVWGTGAGSDEEMTDPIRDLYDLAARVTGDEVPFDAARALFTRNEGLRAPDTVLSLAPFTGPARVTLRHGVPRQS
ncbi:transglutaminase-like domain-containing protein [Streptomyces sp. PTD5-9]|uniref:transglutaminase-like domain-containing protein n=1 Tax=Streptomyces sp. PTD5-9 TaxID=3120150 RepID=UPI0030097D3D